MEDETILELLDGTILELLDGDEHQQRAAKQMLLTGIKAEPSELQAIIFKLCSRTITHTTPSEEVQFMVGIIGKYAIKELSCAGHVLCLLSHTHPSQHLDLLYACIRHGEDYEKLSAIQLCTTLNQPEVNFLVKHTPLLLAIADTKTSMRKAALTIIYHLAKDPANHEFLFKEVGIFLEGYKSNEKELILLICELAPSFPEVLAPVVVDTYIACLEQNDTTMESVLQTTCACPAVQNILIQTRVGDKIMALGLDTQTQVTLLKILYAGQERSLCELLLVHKLAGTNISQFTDIIFPFLLNHAVVSMNMRNDKSPWQIDSSQLSSTQKKYSIIDSQPRDFSLVADLYTRCPVPGYELRTVRIVYNENLSRSFSGAVDMLEDRHHNVAFQPQWKQACKTNQESEQREQVMKLFSSLSQNFHYDRAPHVSFLPLWHGSNPAAFESLFTTGFANLASTDAGFFGKGLYATADAEYAYRVYSKGALLINWVAVFSAFPVIAQDEADLAEGGNFESYDAHFAPVFSPNHPNTTNYHACNYGEQAQYTELVVFESAQMLPHYIVELQPSLIQNPSIVCVEPLKLSSPSTHNKPALEWNISEVLVWVSQLNLSQDYTEALVQSKIDGRRLMTMTKNDWQSLGIRNFGDLRTMVVSVSCLLK